MGPTKHELLRKQKKDALDLCYEEIDRYINENRSVFFFGGVNNRIFFVMKKGPKKIINFWPIFGLTSR